MLVTACFALPTWAADEGAAAAKDSRKSPSKLYESVLGYLEGFRGKSQDKPDRRSLKPAEQRRSPTAFTPDDSGPRRIVQVEKRLAFVRAERGEWDMAALSLERAARAATRLAASDESAQLQEMLRNARNKGQRLQGEKTALPGEITNSVGMRLVVINAGTFTMGSSAAEIRRVRNEWNVEEALVQVESPAHSVRLSKPFLIGKYPVTVGQFKAFVGDTGYRTVAEAQGWGWAYDKAKKHWSKKSGASWKSPGNETWDDMPVTMICHADAEAFCDWLSKKEGRRYYLPTEAQWEYAARGGKENRRFPWGDEYPDATKLNLADRRSPVPWADLTVDDNYSGPSPVGCYDPNGFGLYDAVGNVWQMCSDYYDPKAYEGKASQVSVDPAGPGKTTRKVVRGGNWAFGAGIARNAYRFGIEPDQSIDVKGFRVAAVAVPGETSLDEAAGEASRKEVTGRRQITELLEKVKELTSQGRRLEARRLVEGLKVSEAPDLEGLQAPKGFVKDVLYSLIDSTPDKSLPSFTNSLGMKMVRIPQGSFIMGSSESDIAWAMSTLAAGQPVSLENEFPWHKVRITRPFFVASTEVTVAQFKAFVDETGYITDAEDAKGGQAFNTRDGRFEQKAGSSWKDPGWTISPDEPVTMMSYNDAQAFVEWLAAKEKLPYKLPTEAQWEYAARGGLSTGQFPWGDAVPDGRRANYADKNTGFEWRDRDADDGYKHVAQVGSYEPNGYGLYDMAGNVIEWVRDYYSEDYYRYTPEIDPEGPGHGENRLTKGGDWTFSAVGLRCAFRGWSRQDMAFVNTGFRVAIETANLQRPFDFAANFLAREWVPGPDQREVTAAVAKEKERRAKAAPPVSQTSSKKEPQEVPVFKGVLILDFTPKSDGKKIGLAKGDIITEYNGTGDLTADKLIALTAKSKKEKARPLVVFIRDGYEYSLRALPGFLGISVVDTTFRGPVKRVEPKPERDQREDRDKKTKPLDWT